MIISTGTPAYTLKREHCSLIKLVIMSTLCCGTLLTLARGRHKSHAPVFLLPVLKVGINKGEISQNTPLCCDKRKWTY